MNTNPLSTPLDVYLQDFAELTIPERMALAKAYVRNSTELDALLESIMDANLKMVFGPGQLDRALFLALEIGSFELASALKTGRFNVGQDEPAI
jgi:hypothetical protein